jgi:hypothetical protein
MGPTPHSFQKTWKHFHKMGSVGRIHFLSSDIMDRMGSKPTAEDHQRLPGYYTTDNAGATGKAGFFKNLLNTGISSGA